MVRKGRLLHFFERPGKLHPLVDPLIDYRHKPVHKFIVGRPGNRFMKRLFHFRAVFFLAYALFNFRSQNKNPLNFFLCRALGCIICGLRFKD